MLKNNKVFYCQALSKVFYDEINYHKEAFCYFTDFQVRKGYDISSLLFGKSVL